jgi:hypothetical protein
MAVRAAHLALVDLCFDTCPCTPSSGIGRYVGDLVPDVIELEHDDVSLATVDAWMLSEVVDDFLADLRASVCNVGVDSSALALPISRVVPSVRLSEALPTPGLEPRLSAPHRRKRFERLHLAAFRARSHERERADISTPLE